MSVRTKLCSVSRLSLKYPLAFNNSAMETPGKFTEFYFASICTFLTSSNDQAWALGGP
jgi:hypothetical protein